MKHPATVKNVSADIFEESIKQPQVSLNPYKVLKFARLCVIEARGGGGEG